MLYSLPFLATALTFLFFSYLMIKKTKNIQTNFLFILILISTFWWQIIQFFIQYIEGELLSLFLKLEYISIFFIPIFFYHFVLLITRTFNIRNKIILYIGYFIAFSFNFILFLTDKIVNGYYNYFWGIYQKAGEWHFIFTTFTTIYMIMILVLLVKSYQKSTIIEHKKQIFYLLLATFAYSSSAIDFIANYGYGKYIYPFGFVFLLLFVGFMFYAISKYNLISVKSILNKVFVVIILSIASYIFWWAMLIIEYAYIGEPNSEQVRIFNIIVMPVYIYLSIEFYKKTKRFAHNIFENFDKNSQIRNFLAEIGEKNSKNDVIEYILNKIPLILKSDAAFIFYKKGNYKLVAGQNFDAELKSDILGDFYLRNRRLTRVEELNLKAVLPDSKNNITRKLMNKYDIAIMMLLSSTTNNNRENDVCLLLQKKNDGSIFYKEEIEFLENVGDIIAKRTTQE